MARLPTQSLAQTRLTGDISARHDGDYDERRRLGRDLV